MNTPLWNHFIEFFIKFMKNIKLFQGKKKSKKKTKCSDEKYVAINCITECQIVSLVQHSPASMENHLSFRNQRKPTLSCKQSKDCHWREKIQTDSNLPLSFQISKSNAVRNANSILCHPKSWLRQERVVTTQLTSFVEIVDCKFRLS